MAFVSTSVSFIPNEAGIQLMLHSPTGSVSLYMTRQTQLVAARARDLAPRSTGKLRASIKVTMVPGPTGLIGKVEATAPYAKYVHDGARPHLILPKNKTVLKFPTKGSGAVIWRPSAQHPGQAGNPFLKRALQEVIAF